MQTKLFCSTGTIISRRNGYDYTLMHSVLTPIVNDLRLDGCEFMMLPAFYEKLDEIVEYMKSVGMLFPVFHTDKEIGVLISNSEADSVKKAMHLFEVNCGFAKRLGSSRVVLHFWGGINSDYHFSDSLYLVREMCSVCETYGLELDFENIPCANEDPVSHWEAIHAEDSRARFIYDTRFGEFHRQNGLIPTQPLFTDGFVTHMHISDFIGEKGEFSRLRPILHPGEGQIDFGSIFSAIKGAGYRGSVTLESPVVHEDGSLDVQKLRNTLEYLVKELKN